MKRDRTVQNIEEIPFTSVDWGQTKELVGRFCVAQSDNILVKISEYLPHFEHSTHVHPEQEEVIFVLSGKAISETETGRIDLYPGCVAHVPAGVVHATYNPNDEPCRAVIIKSPPDKDQYKN